MNISIYFSSNTFTLKAGVTLNLLHNQTLLKNFYYIYAALFILFLIYFFSGIGALGVLVNYMAIGVLIISWIFSSRLFKMIGGLFITVGVIFTLTSGEGFGAIISNSTSNLPLLMFFSLLPWIGTVVKVGGLDESMLSSSPPTFTTVPIHGSRLKNIRSGRLLVELLMIAPKPSPDVSVNMTPTVMKSPPIILNSLELKIQEMMSTPIAM